MSRRVYILVPGIFTRTDDNHSWCVRMVDEIMQGCRSTFACATEFRYFAGAFTRRFKQQLLARQLASVIAQWARVDFEIVLVGHSNGCDLIERAVGLANLPLHSLHLIAAAANPDFTEAGYTRRIEGGLIRKIVVYVSRSDSALGTWARLSQIGQFFGLGYGCLGQVGPQPHPGAGVTVIQRDYLEHGEWFSPENWNATVEAVTVAERMHV